MTRNQRKHLGIQIIRRSVQLAVIVALVGIVFLSLYAHYRAARALEDDQFVSGWKGKVLTEIDRHVGERSDAQALLDGFKGNLWSMRFAGLDLTDPLAAVEMTAASKTVYVPILLSILIPILVTMILGRVFCSWICPAGLLFELTGKLRALLRFAELPPGDVKFSHRNKYAILAIGILVVALIGLPIFSFVYPPVVLSRLAHAWIFGTALSGMLVLMGAIILFELFVSPRWWCRTMCPGGALYGLLGWKRALRVELDPSRCTGCRDCVPVCEPGLNPIRESATIECDNCGVCIQHCADQALRFTLGIPGKKRKPARKPAGAVLMVFAFVVALAGEASGHHILGLPHYSYKENYPQAPTLEYPATTGPYDVLLTSYPGRPVPGESANLAFYIKNRETGMSYDQPITVRVLRTFTFGRNRVILPATEVEPFEVPHKISVTFPTEGEYVVELTMDVEGVPETIPFMMISGAPTATASILVAIVAGLAVFLITIRAIKIKQARRRSAITQTVAAPTS